MLGFSFYTAENILQLGAVRLCQTPGLGIFLLSTLASSVHRLGGNRYGMWTEENSGKMWLWDSMYHRPGGIVV